MTAQKILTINNPETEKVLHQPSTPITEFNDKLTNLINDLINTMKSDIICVGLSAPQIGINQQVAVICPSRNFDNAQIIINPTNIIESGKKDRKRESCMSLPDLCGNVDRRQHLTFNNQTVTGETISLSFDSFEARAVMHEIDHLNGILYSDKLKGELTPIDFNAIRKKLRNTTD